VEYSVSDNSCAASIGETIDGFMNVLVSRYGDAFGWVQFWDFFG